MGAKTLTDHSDIDLNERCLCGRAPVVKGRFYPDQGWERSCSRHAKSRIYRGEWATAIRLDGSPIPRSWRKRLALGKQGRTPPKGPDTIRAWMRGGRSGPVTRTKV